MGIWINVTMCNPLIGDGKILVNTDNISYVLTGQASGYEGETLIYFSGDEEDFLPVKETVNDIEEIIRDGLKNGE